MKVIVLGAGVIGVTTAFELAKHGCEVTVIDRQPGVALETSYANAGEISPGYASPWAGPAVPFKAIRWLLMKHGPLVIRPSLDPHMWSWALQMLRNCTSQRYALNKARMIRLAEYSRDCLVALRKETGLHYDERSFGTLQLFRTKKQTDNAADDIAVLKQFGVPFELLDADGCVVVEPALAAVREKIAGGLRLPADETGDCYLFAQGLAALAKNRGVTFRFETDILGLPADGTRVAGVATSAGELKADAYVVALGSYSPLLVTSLGLRLPVYPVKGYSITVPILEPHQAPVSTVMDETYKIAITRLGNRIRVGGTAELAGYDRNLDPERRLTLEHSLSDLFPRGGDISSSTFWGGLRPMTPDGTPVVGRTTYTNLYLNTGHGTLGWTMACGSARVLSDLILGRPLEIDIHDLSLARYR